MINILTKGDKDAPYIIIDIMATRLTEKEFLKVQEINPNLKDYKFTPYDETDFSWWMRINKKLTKKYIYKNVYYEIDYYGKVTEYKH
jgi:hypothetical protein